MARKPGSASRRATIPTRDGAALDVTVVLLDAGYPSTAIAPIEVFHAAGSLWNWFQHDEPRPRFRVRVASLDGRGVTSICSLGLTPECAIRDIKKTDIIVVPTSGWDVLDRIARTSPLVPWLRKWHDRGAYIAGCCTGVAFVAEAGLLDGKRATTHWALAESLRQRYPKVLWQPDRFVTEDGRIFCSGGINSAFDLSLYLVEKFCGHEIALHCAKSLLLNMPRNKQSGYSVLPLARPHLDDRIRESEEYLQEHFGRDVSVDRLADRAGMSPRNFIRRFKAATGRLPGAYIQALRVAAAKEMLERGAASIQSVCSRIGYEDVAFFRSLFKRHTGMTPAEYRSQFGQLSFGRGESAR